ncbi:Aminotransferase-like, plant mobile domain [Sesbania bispinosa]|nr:Aminotransferase-like, plant mobile domain [Sesbania bispinosa]
MVKSYFSGSELLPENSSSSSESSSELIPRSISFLPGPIYLLPRPTPWTLLAARKWMTDVQPAIRPSYCLLLQEFPWTSCALWLAPLVLALVGVGIFKRVEDLNCVIQRWFSTTHTFFTAWGEFAPSLEDVCVLLKLPLFGDYDITSSPIDSHILDKARELKTATIKSAKYSHEFLTRMRSEPSFVGGSSVKTPPRKVKGTGNVLPPAQRKVARESLNYTYATWISFYGRLDQVQDQLLSSFGRFPINTFVDLIFLQCFLFERYPEYAPVRAIPEPPSEGDERPLEPRVWGWASGCPRHSLLDIIDGEDQFVHRPYTKNFFPGVEGLHRLYQESEFASRNVRSTRVEGVFDVWHLILRPPAVLFGTNEGSLHFDSSRFIPPERSGRVLDVWVAYYARLKTAIKRYEQQDSMQHFPNIPIMCKDPYYITSSLKAKPRQGGEGGPKRKAKAPKAFHSDPPVTVASRKSAPRSSRAKKMPLLPVRASVRLREKPSNKSSNPSSSYSPVEIVGNPGSPTPSTPPFHIPVMIRLYRIHLLLLLPILLLGVHLRQRRPWKDPVVAPLLEPSEINVSNPIGGASILSSLLPEEDAHMLVDFASRHEGFLLSEKDFPLAFLKPAYAVFADFLRFVRTHSVADLLGVHKGKVVGDLKALALFGFKGGWFERIVEQLSQSIPLAAFEDMEKLADAIIQQSQRSNELKTQLEHLEAELAQSKSELERLSLRRKEIEDARAILNSSLDL